MAVLSVVLIIAVLAIALTIIAVFIFTPTKSNVGAGCSRDSQCTNGLVCDSSSSKCAVPTNGSCTSDSQCITGTSCINNVCSLPPPPAPQSPPAQNPAPVVPAYIPIQDHQPIVAQETVTVVDSPPRIERMPSPIPVRNNELIMILDSDTSDDNTFSQSSTTSEFDLMSAPTDDSDTDSDNDLLLSRVRYEVATNDPISIVTRNVEGMLPCKFVSSKAEPIVDICAFSDSIFYVLKPGTTIIRHTNLSTHDVIKSRRPVTRIISFGGYMYGLISGLVHQLKPSSYNTDAWVWQVATWTPENVSRFTTTLDGKYIGLHVDDELLIYDIKLKLVQRMELPRGYIRNLGLDISTYVDINVSRQHIVVYVNGIQTMHNNIHYAIFNSYGELVVIESIDSQRHREVKLINWLPYYVSY